MAGILTDKFFDSPLYKALQAPYNDRMARERAASNPLAPSQGGSWPQARPRSTALTPQNYTPTVLPPDNSKRLAAATQPFPLAYPPVDIPVNGGNPALSASIPMPQRRPWDAPTSMDLAAIAAQGQPPVESAYAPTSQTPAAVAAINGLSPLTASERINQPTPGAVPAYNSPRDMSRAEMYDATNAAAATAAQTRDRSGFGTDGYVRDSSGNVIGRDGQYRGLSPSQMYDQINGNGPRPGTPGTDRNGNRIDGNPDNHTFSSDGGQERWEKLGFSSRGAMMRAENQWRAEQGLAPSAKPTQSFFDYARQQNRASSVRVGTAGSVAPVTAGPTQAPRAANTPKRPKLPAARSYR